MERRRAEKERKRKGRKKQINGWGEACVGERAQFFKKDLFSNLIPVRFLAGIRTPPSPLCTHAMLRCYGDLFYGFSRDGIVVARKNDFFLSPYVHFDAGGCGEYEFAKDFFGEEGSEHALLHGYFT